MKQYNIYVSPLGGREAVKQGWSWPGFCFNWIWCFVKKLNGHGAGILVASLMFGIMSFASEALDILTTFAGIGISIWLGATGNNIREENLFKRGFAFKGTVSAETPEGAIAMYANDNQDETPPNHHPKG
jgi:hypothetical protein